MSLSIGKSIVYHPHRVGVSALGSKVRVTISSYRHDHTAQKRRYTSHTLEATLSNTAREKADDHDGAIWRTSSNDRYILVLDQTADYDELTADMRNEYAIEMQKLVNDYETNFIDGVKFLPQVKVFAAQQPSIYLYALCSDHVLAEGDTLSIALWGYQPNMSTGLGTITDIEILE